MRVKRSVALPPRSIFHYVWRTVAGAFYLETEKVKEMFLDSFFKFYKRCFGTIISGSGPKANPGPKANRGASRSGVHGQPSCDGILPARLSKTGSELLRRRPCAAQEHLALFPAIPESVPALRKSPGAK
jgi:hypothetical protein